eukprot:TRINITY_DN5734_c1_g2_i1.p1 TRINITY_DN5734_c1_g2~~TRINITY_DN5734_c1_g2_i1.p1  ORF type:complete len:667 (-),score=138.81 TRINITY_DN5734_c1_g2_i1:56-1957(-)
MYSVFPPLDPFSILVLQNVTIKGYNFGALLRVEIRADGSKEFLSLGEFPTRFNPNVKDRQVVDIPHTALDQKLVAGYSSLRLSDAADAASRTRTYTDAIYATANCPFAGQFGVGNDCRDCPRNAYCPGGARMWPVAGYWTPDEFAEYVVGCNPPAACPGGRFSPCASGYRGEACGICDSEFVRASSGECVAEFGGAGKGILAMMLIIALCLIALACYAGRRSSLFALPFVVQFVRLGQAYAFVVLDTRGRANFVRPGTVWIRDLVAVFITPVTGYVGFYGDDSVAVNAFFRGICFTWIFAVPVLIVPALEFAADKLAEHRGTSRAGLRLAVSIRGHLHRAAVIWVWLMSVPLAVVSLRTMPCSEGMMAYSPSVKCGSPGHVAAAVLGTMVVLALVFVHFRIAQGVRRVASAVDAEGVANDDFAAYAFVYGQCTPAHVDMWRLDAVPASVAIVFSSMFSGSSTGTMVAVSLIFTFTLMSTAAFVARRRPYRDFANSSHVLGLISLVFVVWIPVVAMTVSRHNAAPYLITFAAFGCWCASLVLGIIALWKSRKLKRQLNFPAGYGNMDDEGNIVALDAVTINDNAGTTTGAAPGDLLEGAELSEGEAKDDEAKGQDIVPNNEGGEDSSSNESVSL